MWPLLTGGRCSEVSYIIQILIGPLKRWPLLAGVRCSEVAVSSGLTVIGKLYLNLKEFISNYLDIILFIFALSAVVVMHIFPL